MKEFQHRIPKPERILAVVEPPCHFVKIGRQMLRRDPMPSSYNPVPSAPRLAVFEMCDAASVPIFRNLTSDLFHHNHL